MPRLPHSLLTKAYAKSPLLPIVLRGTRDLELAINELRWLSEHVSSTRNAATLSSPERKRLLRLCRRREKGEPLQYILGSQPFGPLDLKCRKGVLIPRPETEAYVTHLAKLLCEGKLQQKLGFQFSPEVIRRREQNHRKPLKLRVLDICSGSGCISLLLHALISTQFPYLNIRGVDISEDAIDLANENVSRNTKLGVLNNPVNDWGPPSPQVEFVQQDVLRGDVAGTGYDIIISNPPYISQRKFLTQTTRSVRNFEPKLALVPPWAKSPPPGFPPQEDMFYHRLVDMHQKHQSKVTLMEVGDAEQAVRVVNHILNIKSVARWNHIELWRDFPGQEPDRRKLRMLHVGEKLVPIKGQGKIRAVAMFRNIEWRKPRAQIEGIHRRFYDRKEQPEEPAPLTVGRFGNAANQAQKWRMDWRQERAYITTREEKIRENRRRSLIEEKNKSERTRRAVWSRNGGRKVVRLRESRRNIKPLMGKNPGGVDV